MLVKLTEDNLTDALFYGATLEPTEPFAGSKADVRRQARLMLAADGLAAVCEALIALVDGKPRIYGYDTELRAIVDQARAALGKE